MLCTVLRYDIPYIFHSLQGGHRTKSGRKKTRDNSVNMSLFSGLGTPSTSFQGEYCYTSHKCCLGSFFPCQGSKVGQTACHSSSAEVFKLWQLRKLVVRPLFEHFLFDSWGNCWWDLCLSIFWCFLWLMLSLRACNMWHYVKNKPVHRISDVWHYKYGKVNSKSCIWYKMFYRPTSQEFHVQESSLVLQQCTAFFIILCVWNDDDDNGDGDEHMITLYRHLFIFIVLCLYDM